MKNINSLQPTQRYVTLPNNSGTANSFSRFGKQLSKLLILPSPFYFHQIVKMLRKILKEQMNELPKETAAEISAHLEKMQVNQII